VRLIPRVISPTTLSAAERRIFALLERTDLGPGSCCFHSLNLSQHEYKRISELDFVVMSSHGLLVLEVKGGGVAVRDGVWHFTDRFGMEHRRSEGPFKQAASGMFSLAKRIDQEIPGALDDVVIGYAVIFADCAFNARSVEWDDEIVIDERGLRKKTDLRGHLAHVYEYWAAKAPRRGDWSVTRMDSVKAILRPEFDMVPVLPRRVEEIDALLSRLTQEQYDRLDIIEDNDRIIVSGGAGTGKTVLALEVARRHARSGESVLFLEPGVVLARYVAAQVASEPNIHVVTSIGDERTKYDVLVVDEAQDVMTFDQLDLMDRAVANGLQRGVWRFFLDANRQVGIAGSFESDALNLLRTYGFSANLKSNCRNTRQVATQTRLLTGADLGTPSSGEGPAVRIEYYSGVEACAALLDDRIKELLTCDVAPGDITILSSIPFERSSVRHTKACSKNHIAVVSPAKPEWPRNTMTFATIADFKGLENRFILLVDVEALEDLDAANHLYVGMSRARASLWIAIRKDLERVVSKTTKTNLSSVLKDASAGAL
jgi:hypothetical protein